MGSSGMENVDRADETRRAAAAAGGCSRQGLGRVCRCALLLISRLAHIAALFPAFLPRILHLLSAAINSLAQVGADRTVPWRAWAVSGGCFLGVGTCRGFWGAVPGLWIRYLSGEGGRPTRVSRPMARRPLQSSQSVYGTPARICAPAPRPDHLRVLVSLISRRESRDRVSGWEQQGPFPSLVVIVMSNIVGSGITKFSHNPCNCLVTLTN